MRVSSWTIQDVLVIEPEPFVDDRGFFVRTMSAAALRATGIDVERFVEESQSRSRHRVLRGLHGRSSLTEGKLVRCSAGRVFEVILDLRPWSATFLEWDSLILDDEAHRQVWVPPGLVHGFQVVSEQADVCYRMDALYDPSLDIAVAWNDGELAIPWPLSNPLLSERDRGAPLLAALRPHLDDWFGAAPPS